jgi:hypothetical protein
MKSRLKNSLCLAEPLLRLVKKLLVCITGTKREDILFLSGGDGCANYIVYFFRTLSNVISVMTLACVDCSENCWYLLLSNKLSTVVDLLAHHLSVNLDFFINLPSFECLS